MFHLICNQVPASKDLKMAEREVFELSKYGNVLLIEM